LAHLEPDEIAFRYRAMVGLLALHQAGNLADLQDSARPSGADHETPSAEAEQLVAILTAALRAPSVRPPG
jgi:hypothetical protein